MKIQSSWLSLLANCILLISGAAFAFAIVLAGASVALAGHEAAQAQAEEAPAAERLVQPAGTGSTFSGMITDSRCGARHKRNSGQNSAECARDCVRKGASYILVDGDRRYTLIGNDSTLSGLVGERANVVGNRSGDAIIVDAASPTF